MASEPVTQKQQRSLIEHVLLWMELQRNPGGRDAVARLLADYDAVTAERDRLWLALERVRMYIKDDHEFERTGRELAETGAPKGRTRPKDCSICRREDCTREHACK